MLIKCCLFQVRKEEIAEAPCRGKVKEEELEIFKKELARKRALRHEALGVLQKELRELRVRVDEERSLRQRAEEERDKLKTISTEELQGELEKEREEKKKLLDEVNRLMEEVEEKAGLERQVQALKDVSQIGKEMLRIRELQVVVQFTISNTYSELCKYPIIYILLLTD